MKDLTYLKNISGKDLVSGDLLFSVHPSCAISQEIDLVTQTHKNTHFSHVGLVEKVNDRILIYHSTPLRGVCRESLDQFLHPDEKENIVYAYRLHECFFQFIPSALNSAKELLGEPYNLSFQLTASGYYCSEFIYRIFAPGNIFDLNPMTFKDPETGKFTPHWLEYYSKLNLPIPEHQPGCNPNGMAASEKIGLIGTVKI